jgi:quercetin dioxygenase-like cupin family protein
MPDQPAASTVNPSDETISIGPLTIRFLITARDSLGSVAVFEVHVPAEQRLQGPSHSHDHYEETIYGIEGVLTWTINGNRINVGPGETLCIPRGAIHRFDNNSTTNAKALCIISPAEIGPEYFREVAEVVKNAGPTGPDKSKIAAIMRRHRLTPAA